MNGEWMSIKSSTLRQTVDECFDFVDAEAIHVAADAIAVVGHLVDHLAVRLAEPVALFLKKSQWP